MKFLHVGIGYAKKELPVEDIQKVFGSAGWARYAPNCWIVLTSESPDSLTDRLHKICNEYDSIFVCELAIGNHQGYLHKEIWDWIKKSRQ